MLNYNLNIIEPLQQAKKNEDARPQIYWSFESYASASDSSDLGERGFATMSINAISSNCFQVSNDNSGFFTTDDQAIVTASLSGSNWPVTGSTTMSLNTAGITYDPIAVNQYYSSAVSASAIEIASNPSITGSIITNEFLASEFYRFYVDGVITHYKQNVYNPLVNVIASGSVPNTWNYFSGSNTILNIVKDVNVPVSMSIGYITGSQISSFNYAYNLGVTASLTASASWPVSASYLHPTMSLSITGSTYSESIISYSTSSIITASFAADNNNPYTIEARIKPRYIPQFSASFTLFAAGGKGANSGYNLLPGGGGGTGAMYTASFNIVPNRMYYVNVGSATSGSGETTFFGFNNGNLDITIPITASLQKGRDASTFNGGNSGTGSVIIGTQSISLPLFLGGTGDNQSGGGTIRYAAGGGAGSSQNGTNGQATNRISGNGGNGQLDPILFALGGGGGGGGADRQNFSAAVPGAGGLYGGGNGGNGLGAPESDGKNATYYGAGGGGASNTQSEETSFAGIGSDGVLIIKYYGSGSRFTATNATISYEGGITQYTFGTGSGTFIYNYEPVENPPAL